MTLSAANLSGYVIDILPPGSSDMEKVKPLQTWLVKNGFLTQAQMDTGPGIYGPATTAAVASLQQQLGIDAGSGLGLDTEFIRKVEGTYPEVRGIGYNTFINLSPWQQAALVSLAYNHGSLPPDIIQDFSAGASVDKIANDIAAEPYGNTPRRLTEAKLFRWGSGAAAPAGSVSISDVAITEGNSGIKYAGFTVTRSGGSAAFSVHFATANGTATAGSDYHAASGVLSFAAGDTAKTISVPIYGDTTVETNETFFVNLSNATNGASLARTQATGTITNDDSSSPITIQPGPEGKDLWITDIYNYNDNFGVDNQELRVGGWGDHYNSLLNFDLTKSNLPSHVQSATLKLYNNKYSDYSTTPMYINRVNTAWDETYGWYDYSLNTTNVSTTGSVNMGWNSFDVTMTGYKTLERIADLNCARSTTGTL